MKGLCQRKDSLFRKWQEATAIHTKAIGELTGQLGHVSEGEYAKLKRITEIARELSQKARAELDAHIAGHSCKFG